MAVCPKALTRKRKRRKKRKTNAKPFVLHANAVNFASPSKNTVEKNDEKKRMTNCKAFCATRKRKKRKTVAKPFALHANAKKKKIMTITKFFALHAKAINIFKLKKDFVIYFFKVKNELTRSCRLNHITPKLLIIKNIVHSHYCAVCFAHAEHSSIKDHRKLLKMFQRVLSQISTSQSSLFIFKN